MEEVFSFLGGGREMENELSRHFGITPGQQQPVRKISFVLAVHFDVKLSDTGRKCGSCRVTKGNAYLTSPTFATHADVQCEQRPSRLPPSVVTWENQ